MGSRKTVLVLLGLGLIAVAALGSRQPREAEAQFGPFDCEPVSVIIPIPVSACEFHNLAIHDVNDIHIVFSGMVAKLSSNPATRCRRTFLYAEQNAGFPAATAFDCTFPGEARGAPGGIPSFGSLDMIVLHINPAAPGPAHVSSWYWTLNGTPVTITPTGTSTPTDTPTPFIG